MVAQMTIIVVSHATTVLVPSFLVFHHIRSLQATEREILARPKLNRMEADCVFVTGCIRPTFSRGRSSPFHVVQTACLCVKSQRMPFDKHRKCTTRFVEAVSLLQLPSESENLYPFFLETPTVRPRRPVVLEC
jgi:hypothetical protein